VKGSKGGFKVLQLASPGARARVRVAVPPGGGAWAATTRNVRRLALVAVDGWADPDAAPAGGLSLDGTRFTAAEVRALRAGFRARAAHLCLADPPAPRGRAGARAWRVCEGAPGVGERGPASAGPARQVVEAPFLIVAGSGAGARPPAPGGGSASQVCPRAAL
jgi:hypothetical protein